MANRPTNWRHKLELANRRLHKWNEERQVLLSKEHRTASKGWKTRYRNERKRADRNAKRAQRDKAVAEPQVVRAVQARKPIRRGFEYVLKVDYKKAGKQNRHRSVFWDVRLRKAGAAKASANELRHVVAQLKTTGTLPPHWEATTIAWGRGDREDEPDRVGDPDSDMGALTPTLFAAKIDWAEVGEEEV
ncbi:MAG: hypothetical protein GY906_38725 [bacterium]|nr:hypothetical protein [bacterium]